MDCKRFAFVVSYFLCATVYSRFKKPRQNRKALCYMFNFSYGYLISLRNRLSLFHYTSPGALYMFEKKNIINMIYLNQKDK